MLTFSPEHASEYVWQQVQSLLPNTHHKNKLSLCVGFSGGLDSTVLLDILSKASPSKVNLSAIHINHQLQKDANSWAEFCEKFCAVRNIPVKVIKVNINETEKKGLEAAARNARYAAFKAHLAKDDALLTAHHQDDQVETVFLQLLRGTGIEGAAAIRASSYLDETPLLRPLLSVSRSQLEAYALENKLTWINDPSNTELNYRRNYLRHEILPKIEKTWPSYRKTIQRFSNNARSASNVLDDYIHQEFHRCFTEKTQTLNIDALLNVSLEKRLMVIRHWIKEMKFSTPGEAILLQIHQILSAEEDANPIVEWGDVMLRRYRRAIFLLPRNYRNFKKIDLIWDMIKNCNIENIGTLHCEKTVGEGLQEKYFSQKIKVTYRQGGERCQPIGRQGSHSLKKLFQEFSIPPWQRDQIPILMIEDEIIAVVGLFYCAAYSVKQNELGYCVKLELD